MKTKEIAIILAIVALASVSIATYVDESADADATTVVVDTAEELINAMKASYSVNGSIVTPVPVNISISSDITLVDSDLGAWGTDRQGSAYFCGTINGNGHTITTNFTSGCNYLAAYAIGTTTIENLHIKSYGSVFTLIYQAGIGGGNPSNQIMTFEDVVLDAYVETGNNDSAFIVQGRDCTLNFVDCVNNADYYMSTRSAIFMGGMANGTVNVNFRGCINNGEISGIETYMFMGNDAISAETGQTLSVTVDENCKNNGSITGNKAALFSIHNGNNSTMNQLNESLASRSDLVSNIRMIEKLTISVSYGDEGVITISDANADDNYKVSMSAYATINVGGTYGVILNIDFTDGSVYAGRFLDKNTAMQKYGLDVSGDYITGGATFPYKVVEDANGARAYIFDFGTESNSWTLDANPRISVAAYSDGIYKGAMDAPNYTSDLQSTATTYVGTFQTYSNVEYDIMSAGGNIVKEGESIQFSVAVLNGYEVVSVKVGDTVLTADSGVYTYVPTSDFTVTVETKQVAYSVSYNLSENVSLSSMPSTIGFNDPYYVTISVSEGYEIAVAIVTMGGENLRISGNVIDIPSVTGNLSINITASPIDEPTEDSGDSGWNDDEDLPPFIPTQTAEDDNTVTIVACASAAAVAAIMAVFLIIDRKG